MSQQRPFADALEVSSDSKRRYRQRQQHLREPSTQASETTETDEDTELFCAYRNYRYSQSREESLDLLHKMSLAQANDLPWYLDEEPLGFTRPGAEDTNIRYTGGEALGGIIVPTGNSLGPDTTGLAFRPPEWQPAGWRPTTQPGAGLDPSSRAQGQSNATQSPGFPIQATQNTTTNTQRPSDSGAPPNTHAAGSSGQSSGAHRRGPGSAAFEY